MDTPSPRRRLAPAERRELLLDAAAEAFTRAPYSSVGVGEIAERAGVSEALVYRYFDTKATLYTEVVRRSLLALGVQQQAAIDAAPPGEPVHAILRRTTLLYLDFVERHAERWAARASSDEPAEAAALRDQARAAYVDALAGLLRPSRTPRHALSLWGFMGFIDAACDAWVARGTRADEKEPLVDACIGALEGALGDWDA